MEKAEKIVLVAHGCAQPGAWSNDRIKIITKSGRPLTFDEAVEYIGGKSFPEFASSSLGSFAPLSDDDCRSIFGCVPVGRGIINTGLRRGGSRTGERERVFVLREAECTFAELGVFASRNNVRIVLAACRTLD